MQLSELAGAVGKGIFAGLAGTAAMTVSSTIEMKLVGREASDTPSKVAGKMLAIQPRNPTGRKRLSNAAHWTYGTSWGVFRGLLSTAGVREPAASVLHFLAVWGTSLIMLPSFDVSSPVTEWDAETIATDVLHHAVYAAVTGAAFTFIERH